MEDEQDIQQAFDVDATSSAADEDDEEDQPSWSRKQGSMLKKMMGMIESMHSDCSEIKNEVGHLRVRTD
eukprot:6155741-Karenia_brevis.AAC.1